jgi:hypothetical protein
MVVRKSTKPRIRLHDKSFAIPTGYVPNKNNLLDILMVTSHGFLILIAKRWVNFHR